MNMPLRSHNKSNKQKTNNNTNETGTDTENALRWKMEMLEAMKSNVRVIMLFTKRQRKAHRGEDEVPDWSRNTQYTDWEAGRTT